MFSYAEIGQAIVAVAVYFVVLGTPFVCENVLTRTFGPWEPNMEPHWLEPILWTSFFVGLVLWPLAAEFTFYS